MFLPKQLHQALSRLAHHPRSLTSLRCHRARLALERLDERVVPDAITFTGKDGIYIMDETGANVRKLTDGFYNYDLSPDGKQIIYSYNLNTRQGAAEIWTLSLAFLSDPKITPKPFKLAEGFSARWSPSGEQIVFAGRYGDKYGIIKMYVGKDAQADKSTWMTTRLTDHGQSNDNAPDWSPDEKHIVFTSTYLSGQSRYLWIMSVANPSDAQQIKDPHGLPIGGGAPSWKNGPNNKIVFGVNGISTVNPDGTGLKQLRSSGGGPYWSPDGSQIAFAEGPTMHASIYKMTVNADGTAGSSPQLLGGGGHPSWSVSSNYFPHGFPYGAPASTDSTSTNDLALATDTVVALRAGRLDAASFGSSTFQRAEPNQPAPALRPLAGLSTLPAVDGPRVGSGPVSFRSSASGKAAVDVVISAWDHNPLEQMFLDQLPWL